MGFSRQGDWSGLPCPPPGDLPNWGTEPGSPALQADSLPAEPPGNMCIEWVLGFIMSLFGGCVCVCIFLSDQKPNPHPSWHLTILPAALPGGSPSSRLPSFCPWPCFSLPPLPGASWPAMTSVTGTGSLTPAALSRLPRPTQFWIPDHLQPYGPRLSMPSVSSNECGWFPLKAPLHTPVPCLCLLSSQWHCPSCVLAAKRQRPVTSSLFFASPPINCQVPCLPSTHSSVLAWRIPGTG